MSDLPVSRDFDGRFRVEGFEELSFTTQGDAQKAAMLAEHYFMLRCAREMLQESRFRLAAAKAQVA